VATALLLAAILSAGLVLMCHGLFYASAMPLRPIIADRLPGLTLTGIAIAWASRHVGASAATQARSHGESAIDELPPAEWIDWVRAAGNYVEIHVRGRVLLRRMTLRQAAQALEDRGFVQIHRSVLVNQARIADWDRSERPREVRLADGSVLRVGQAYRAKIA
jgi:DNA-binding LytR/AlgR family response regulator